MNSIFLIGILILFSKCSKYWSKDIIIFSSYPLNKFKDKLENYDLILIYFYASHCDQCMKFLHDISQLAHQINDNPEWSVKVAKVDCSTPHGSQICSYYNLQSYPHLILFKSSLIHKVYQETLDFESVTKWLSVNAKMFSKRFDSFKELNSQIAQSNNPLVIGIFSNSHDSMLNDWHKASRQINKKWTFRDVKFFYIYQDYASGKTSCLSSIGLKEGKILKPTAIILHRPAWLQTKLEKANVIYIQSSRQDLTEWITSKIFGLVFWRDRSNQDDIKLPLIVAYYDFDFIKRSQFSHRWRNRLLRAAKNYTQLNFAISNSHTFRKSLSKFNLEAPQNDEKPIFIGYDILGSANIMNSTYNRFHFDQFLNQIMFGSSSNGCSTKAGSMLELGASNFSQCVTYNKKNVFIMFYASWCKYCQEFESTWFRLAQEMRNEVYLQFARMDAVINQLPSTFKVIKFPTIYLVLKTNKKLILYKDGNQLHQLVQFLAKHVNLTQFDEKGGLKPKLKKDEL